MRVRELRAIMSRYKNAGVLLVGAYLALHHAWHRRRALLLATIGLSLFCVTWLLLHPTAKRHAVRKAPPFVSAAPVAPPPPLHLVLQDDTAPVSYPPPVGSRPFPADGALVFSGQFYRFSGKFYQSEEGGEKEETLTSEGKDHLYRLTTGRARPQQLTFGEGDDASPALSPDGRRVAFLRTRDDREALCTIGVRGGHVRTLCTLKPHQSGMAVHWSPDGRWLSVLTNDQDNEDDLLLCRIGGKRRIYLYGVQEAAWSPEGRLYLRKMNDNAYIFEPKTQAWTSIRKGIKGAVWLDAHTLLGDTLDNELEDGRSFAIIDDRGRLIRKAMLTQSPSEDERTTFDNRHRWYRSPYHPTIALLQTAWGMSDGEHGTCYWVDTRTGQAQLIAAGTLIGIAPDGMRIAVTDNDWVGPYKRGGERVGPLQIVSLATGRIDDVTDPLSCIQEGVWQTAPPHTKR